MRSLLFLCHRIPFPPDKGEKIRAFRILEHLSRRFRVSLGCFVDDDADWAHVDALKPYCADLKCLGMTRNASRLKAACGLLTSAPLSVACFANAAMGAWVTQTLAREKPAAVFVYSSAMAQFVMGRDLGDARLIMDFVDVDSDKWRQYAQIARPPMQWIYAREARLLLAHDRKVAARADASLLVSDAEAGLFRRLAPESADKIRAVSNGIDCDFFSPTHRFERPFKTNGPAYVFTGTMDYRPNVEAVIWFANEIFPKVKAEQPGAVFAIVGAKPAKEVSDLGARDAIIVTGRVADVRPYLAHADVVVAPLRIARGIQNKVLEGMAMAKPVVTTQQGLEGIDATPDRHLIVSDTTEGFAAASLRALAPGASEIGRAARALMEASYAWPSRLAALDHLI
jgi:sugar transferase (PEP-CTERM/EpsH1 system associated)